MIFNLCNTGWNVDKLFIQNPKMLSKITTTKHSFFSTSVASFESHEDGDYSTASPYSRKTRPW